MSVDRRRAGVFAAAAAVRLLLFAGFPSLPWLLTGRVEVSTPVTSFKRLQEGLFLYLHNVSPYDGGVFYQAPLLLPLFALIPSGDASALLTPILYTAIDLVCAYALMQIADSGESRATRLYSSPRRLSRYSSAAVAAGYLFNPLTIATCLGRSTAVFSNAAVLVAVAAAVQRKYLAAMVVGALAAYLSLAPVLLLPPLVLLCYDRHVVSVKEKNVAAVPFVLSLLATFAGAAAVYLGLSYVLTGFSWEFVRSTYGVQLLLPDLTPNTGLWWYFFIEMFDSFREFFLGVFWLHMVSYVGGLCIRIRTQPLFVITTMLGIMAIFKPYPSVADTSLYLAMLSLYRHIFPLMRYTFLAAAIIIYASLLGPAFYWLWIYAGSGNANFFYAITLVWSLGLSFIVADSIWAVLRDEWEVERPEVKGKVASQI